MLLTKCLNISKSYTKTQCEEISKILFKEYIRDITK